MNVSGVVAIVSTRFAFCRASTQAWATSCDLVDAIRGRKVIEKALSHDREHLAGTLLDRRYGLGVAVIVFRQVLDQRAKLPGAFEIDIVLKVGDDDAGRRAARKRVEEPFERADRKVTESGVSNGFPLSHLKVAGELIEKYQDGLIAKDRHPFVHARRSSAIPPERRHDIGPAELLGDITPEKAIGVLMAVEDDNLGGSELTTDRQPRKDLLAQVRIGGEQAKSDQAVRLTAAHGLGEVKCAIITLAC